MTKISSSVTAQKDRIGQSQPLDISVPYKPEDKARTFRKQLHRKVEATL